MINERQKFFRSLYIIDTETTSKDFNEAEVIEVGSSVYDGNSDDWVKEEELFKPDDRIEPEISVITGITNDMVKDKDSFVTGASVWKRKIEDFDEKENIIGLAHNSFYDQKVLERYGINLRQWLCTLKISRKLYRNDDSVKQFNLPYLRYRFELEIPEHLHNHRAGTDCYITGKLLEKMVSDMEDQGIIDQNDNYYDQIEDWLNKPVILEKVPFGKYSGQPFSSVPDNYWSWALSNMDSLDENSEQYDRDLAASIINLYQDR